MGLLSSFFGTGAYNQAISDLKDNKAAETSYYQKMAYEDPLNDSAAAAAMKQARDQLTESSRQAAASAAVTGATDESVARQKAAGSQAVADAASRIAQEGTARKDNAMQNYLQASRDYTAKINDLKLQREQQQTAALGGLLNSGIGLASKFIPEKTVLNVVTG